MKINRPIRLFALALLGLIAVALGGAYAQLATQKNGSSTKNESKIPASPAATAADVSKPIAGKGESLPMVPDPKQVGGEPEGIVQVANLVYAGVKSSHCFADHFLVTAEKESSISTSRRFHAVKLGSEELYNFPLVIMTGEGAFQLTQQERQNLKQFIERGGFLLASAGCSSPDWDRSFRKEMAAVFPEQSLVPLGMEHPVFHTVYDITEMRAKHGTPKPLEGVSLGGRLGVIYSQDGLNDTAHTQGCCCCGGNEILNAIQINVNILAYSLIY
jgi:hypothetical protein